MTPQGGNRATARLFPESAGRPLEPAVRGEMEAGFGTDFSAVRVHTGQRAERGASALNARAVTYGGDIVFARGEYAPGSTEGRRLLAHELAHVVQQSEGHGPAPSASRNGPTETDASMAASQVVSGGRARVRTRSAPGIARQEAEPGRTPAVAGASDREKLTNALAVLDSIREIGSNQYQVTLDGRVRHLTQADVNAALGRTRSALRQNLTRVQIKAEGAVDGYGYQAKVDAEFPIVSGFAKFVGGIDDPGPRITALAGRALEAIRTARAELEVNHFARAGQLLAEGETSAKKADRLYQDYHNKIISTGETTITVLEYTRDVSFIALAVLATVATAGAAAGVTSVGGVGLGAASTANTIALFAPLAGKLGEAGVKTAYGDPVDWGQLAVDAVITIVVAKFGGKLSTSIAGRIIGQNPAAASAGRHVVAGIVSGVISGRASALVGAATNALYAKLRGKEVTWEGFVEQVAAALTDPKSAALDLMLGAIGAYGAGKGAIKPGGGVPVHEKPPAATAKPQVHETPPARAAAVKAPMETPVDAPVAAKPVRGPVIEEKRISPTVIRRRRGPAEPAAPVAEKPGPQAAKTPAKVETPGERKARFGAEAQEEIEAYGKHEDPLPERTDDVRDRPDLREREIHTPTHPEILAAALERAGMPRPPGHDPHHVVPTSGGAEAGERARDVLRRAGLHNDAAENGVWLPRTTLEPVDPRIPAEGLSRHQTIHTKRYYEAVAERLEAGERTGNVAGTLQAIRSEIADGVFPQ